MFFLSGLAWIYLYYTLLRLYLKMTTPNKIVITVDGNVGSGKSTLLGILEATGRYSVIPEPTSQWKETGILEKYYYDQKRNAYEFQSFVLTSHDKEIQNALGSSDIVITERCPETHRAIFFKLLEEKNYFDTVQKNMYERIFGSTETRADAMIYIDSDVDLSYARIVSRGRQEEKNIKKTYIQSVEDKHRDYVNSYEKPLLTVNGRDFKNNTDKVIAEIVDFVNFVRGSKKRYYE